MEIEGEELLEVWYYRRYVSTINIYGTNNINRLLGYNLLAYGAGLRYTTT